MKGQLLADFFTYFASMLLLTLGVLFLCGLVVYLLERCFYALLGRAAGGIFSATAIIGTPVHELGHALMCLLFGHKIVRMRLWSPTAENGLYGFVEHSYNRKNPWARLGNLFIGVGPLFSGLAVVLLMLWLCFPSAWSEYLANTNALLDANASIGELMGSIPQLLINMPQVFADNWAVGLVGTLVILAVALHVQLSPQDIKGSLSALPIYVGLVAIFSLLTFAIGVNETITHALQLFNLRMLTLFVLIAAFAAVWVLFALLVRILLAIVKLF